MNLYFIIITVLLSAFISGSLAYNAVASDTNMNQGWSDQDRTDWCSASQGSRLLPLRGLIG